MAASVPLGTTIFFQNTAELLFLKDSCEDMQKGRSLLNGVPNVPTCPTCPRALRAIRAHAPCVLYVPYVPTRPNCPTCPRAQVYFTDQKIKKWKFCTHTFLRVLSLIFGLNFRNYRFIQTREKFQIEFFSYNKLTFCSNNVSLNVLQQPYISI